MKPWSAFRSYARLLLRDPVNSLLHAKLHFGQFGEDIFVRNYFHTQPTGVYVDVGAYHPFCLSNTWLLYRHGWRGLCVEPNPATARLFRKWRPRDILVNVAITREAGNVSLTLSENESHVGSVEDQRTPQISVPALPLARVIDDYLSLVEVPLIDFMSIDCEGLDEEVLHSGDWQRHRPTLVAVEDSTRTPDAPVCRYLESQGYRYLVHLGITAFFEDQGPGRK
jgi:FkbM family methyltransferase